MTKNNCCSSLHSLNLETTALEKNSNTAPHSGRQMPEKKNVVAWNAVLNAHGRMVVANTEIDLVLGCVLVDMYRKCRHLYSARRSASVMD
ncbi:hypothetical protein U9M48_041446 [Paspalum notatum var. saurae]|uniref:Uncharacterized protein n=1 Tax=Paspalum notatum var. saurae TaxID=547442 RepID=A0AAQ3UP79_PASNO